MIVFINRCGYVKKFGTFFYFNLLKKEKPKRTNFFGVQEKCGN